MTKRSSRWWSAIATTAALLVSLAPSAAFADGTAVDPHAPVHTYRATPGDVRSDRFALTANGTDVFVTKYANRSNNRVHVARFASADATPILTLTNNVPITSWKIYPERYYPAGAVTVSGNTITFTMSDKLRYAIVQLNGTDPQVAIVNDPPEDPAQVPGPSDTNVVNVAGYVTDTTGATDQTPNIVAAIDAVYNDSSKSVLYFPDGWYQYAGLEIRNRTKPIEIYVAEGALLKNRIQPAMEAMEPAIGIWDSANVSVAGRGVLDGNGFANYDTANGGWRHDATTSQHQGGVMVVRSSNVVFDDTLLRDAKQWNWETHTAKNVTFNNIKGLTPYAQPWIDGLDLASGQNITVNGAMTLGNDDTFATGHYNPNDSFPGDPLRTQWDTEDSFNYSINNTLGWSAGAGNAIRMGHAAYGRQMRNYAFTNVNYVGFSAGGVGISVQNTPDSGVRTYPKYVDLSFKDSSFDTSKVGTNFSILGKNSADATDRIATVTLDNLWFSTQNPSYVQNVSDLTINNLSVAGQKVTRLTQTPLTFSNVLVRRLDFPEDVAPIIAPIADQAVTVGDTLAIPVKATDGDGDAITYSIGDGGLPQGATFDTATGTFTWAPTDDQIGTVTVAFVATDARGATGTGTATIVVNNPLVHRIDIPVGADTDVQTWNAEATQNFGDNEHLRVLNFNNSAMGALGEKYTGGQANQDAKLTYLTFDLAPYRDELANADLVKAELRLAYFGPTKGALSGTDTLLVAKATDGWVEGNGKTTPPTRTNSIAGGMTWPTKNAVDGSTVQQSAAFNVTASAKVGNDSTYNATQKPIGTVATTDVTPIVASTSAGSNTLSLAVNETKKYDIIFVSREGAARNPNAAGMAPVLRLSVRDRVDKGALQAAVDLANAQDPAAHSATTWTRFAAALDAARRTLASVSASQAVVDLATTKLSDAQSALAPAVTTVVAAASVSTVAVGSTFDTSTLSVTATDVDGAKHQLPSSDYAVSGFDSSKVGATMVTITVNDALTAPGGSPVTASVRLAVLPTWDATKVYLMNDQVLYNGSTWLASWWTQNKKPGDPNGPWQELRTTTDGAAIWAASRIFVAGDRAVYQGETYVAKWWTRNEAPGNPYGPWTVVTP